MITIHELTKDYGDLRAVDTISFKIRKGEILGLLGPNGAGKSTTLRMLTGYLQPNAGSITVKDLNIQDHPLEIRQLIGYLPEAAPIYPDMFVHDYLCFIANLRQLERDQRNTRIRELADLCGIREVMHKPIHQLSKGYKQRVGLAHAMMNDPEILVLDEPTSGLDPNQIIEIRNIIREIGREKTVILSTHILSEAEATCDRVVIINRGKIVADGTTEELKQQRGQEYIVNIALQQTEFGEVQDALGKLPGVNRVVLAESGNGAIHIEVACRDGQDMRPDLYNAIKKQNWVLLEFRRQTRSLENIFRELTREN